MFLRTMVWSVYIVECRDGSFYTGVTTDVTRRVNEHNTSPRGSKYCRSRRPVKLVFRQTMPNQSHALKVEAQVKRMTRQQKKDMIWQPY